MALCQERKNLVIITIEKSCDALNYALKNLSHYQPQIRAERNEIHLIQGDKFSAIKRQPHFDLIVSNPPYIPDHEIENLQEEVSLWEPGEALAGGKNGTDFIDFLKDSAQVLLKPGGYLIFEHGFRQKNCIQELMNTANLLTLKESIKDYSNNDRVLVYQKSKKFL